jgi:hypothetical protein
MEIGMPIQRDSAAPLADYWSDVKPKRLKRRVVEVNPGVEDFLRWAAQLCEPQHASAITVPESVHTRVVHTYLSLNSFQTGVINCVSGPQTHDWLAGNVLDSFTARVAHARIPEDCMSKQLSSAWVTNQTSWELVWGLIFVEDLVVEDSLRDMVDKGFYLVHSVYRAIWEARFILKEKGEGELLQRMVSSVLQWVQGLPLTNEDISVLTSIGISKRVESDRERADILLFLLTLAAQNALLSRAIFAFNGIDRALRPDSRGLLRQLDSLLGDLDRWSRLGAPVGVILGLDTSRGGVSTMRKLNPKLAERVATGLEWTKHA